MRGMQERSYNVSIETWGDGLHSLDPEVVVELSDMIERLGGSGTVSSIGGLAGGVGATFGITLPAVELDDEDALAHVTSVATRIFLTACRDMGVTHGGIARCDVTTEAYLEREVERPPDRFAGVAELAALFGVSRQRMSELRTRHDFPDPVAELASGPVWSESSLTTFLERWERKPGRPKKVTTPEMPADKKSRAS